MKSKIIYKLLSVFLCFVLVTSFGLSFFFQEAQAVRCLCRCQDSGPCVPCGDWIDDPCSFNCTYCVWKDCANCADESTCEWGDCSNCSSCGGCFLGETEIETKDVKTLEFQNLKISELAIGDIVSSFNQETGEISVSQVGEVTKLTREGYYKLETESGKKVKVTGEHPFLAVKVASEGIADKISGFRQALSDLVADLRLRF